MANLKQILSNSKYTKYAPSLGSPDFSDLRSLVSSSGFVRADSDDSYFLGRSKNNKNNLKIRKSTYKKSSNLKNVFHGFLGGIGEGGVFPFVFDVPAFNLLSQSEKNQVLGNRAQYVDNTNPNDKTFIAIGEQFSQSSFSESFLEEHGFRIFISDMVSKDKYISFPRIKILDTDSVVTHNQSPNKVIEIKNGAVYVYPGAEKRCLKIKTCSVNIRNKSRTESYPGELKALDDTKRGRCIRMAGAFVKSFGNFSSAGFTNLVSNSSSTLSDEEYDLLVKDAADSLSAANVDEDYFKKFTRRSFYR
jgi:hypothetical protein